MGKGDRGYGVTDRANGIALHQQRQGTEAEPKQVLLSHPDMEVTETGLKTQARLWFVLKAQTRTKGAQLCFITEIVSLTKAVVQLLLAMGPALDCS